MILPLIAAKFGIGIVVGILVDLIYQKQKLITPEQIVEEETCQHHHHKNTKIHKHLVHPLIHSLEVLLYLLIINLVIGFIIGFVGEESFYNFLSNSRYLSPLYCSIIGLIPNCSSSLLITELYLDEAIPFGALLSGLLVNSGLGMMVLLKNIKTAKKVLFIIGICFLVALLSGYITCLMTSF